MDRSSARSALVTYTFANLMLLAGSLVFVVLTSMVFSTPLSQRSGAYIMAFSFSAAFPFISIMQVVKAWKKYKDMEYSSSFRSVITPVVLAGIMGIVYLVLTLS